MTAPFKHPAKPGNARETTGGKYGQIYAHDKYLKILNDGAEPGLNPCVKNGTLPTFNQSL
jgi:hypothetical protein